MKILKKSQFITPLYLLFSNKFTNSKWWFLSSTIAFIVLVVPNNTYSIETISFNQQEGNTTLVPNKIDLTKLPTGKIYKVVHEDFILQFFFNNRDIYGYIFKRKKNIGIMAQLCLYRSCEETSYDFRKVIARPFEPPYNNDFFSVKFPQNLQYNFQGLEFLPYK
ncbi:uncharacterized protein METZ01_LOCUS236576 [marine metagenome]|uniref:Uncharacterized protein n=1 Tax=marine metagenome TaxID=408172 RepID=A0A382H940_9ZZZZ